MSNQNIKVEYIDINLLKPSEYNPRQMTKKQAEDLQKSIEGFGMVEPIVVNSYAGRENVIIGGHQRYNICKQLGWTTMPVVYMNLDEQREKELNLRLNRNLGEWNWDMLANFDEELLKSVGFDEELEKLFPKEVVEDEAPEVSEEEPDSKLGEVYQLGRHRVMCGNATIMKNNVEKLMDGQKADLVFTDPPYGMDLDTDWLDAKSSLDMLDKKKIKGGAKYRKVIGDNKPFDAGFLMDMANEVLLFGADYYVGTLPSFGKDGSWFVWDKRLNESADKMYGSGFELVWSKKKHKREIVRVKWVGVFGIEKEFDKKRHHPTQKPMELCSWFIKKFSKQDNIVLDLFGGSGSTLIACEQNGRICYMMELDEKYVDVIRRRYAKFIGKEDEWQNITKKL